MDTGFVGEDTGTDDTLVPAHRTARGFLDHLRNLGDGEGINAGFNAVQILQRQHTLFQCGIPRTFTQTIHCGVDVGSATHDRGQRVGGGQTVVVVGVHLKFEIRS